MSAGAKVALFLSGTGGAPLLLIHSINAAASRHEVEPLRERYSASRTVYCVDLPGFGESDRTDRVYSARLMTTAILDVAREVHRQHGQPIDALAVSLSCEFLARAVTESPALFRSVAMVSPTGFNRTQTFRESNGASRGKPWVYAMLRGPGWGALLYRQLTRPGVIRYFLERTWGSKAIDESLWRADIDMSRYPGAHFAPLYFLSAILFSADIHDVYDAIRLPVWASHGVRGDFVNYPQLPAFAKRGGWQVTTFQTGAMPFFEELERFVAAYDAFLARVAAG